jgi:hypothetical protein
VSIVDEVPGAIFVIGFRSGYPRMSPQTAGVALALSASTRNDTWGEMRTRWAFTITNGKISLFETGQA